MLQVFTMNLSAAVKSLITVYLLWDTVPRTDQITGLSRTVGEQPGGRRATSRCPGIRITSVVLHPRLAIQLCKSVQPSNSGKWRVIQDTWYQFLTFIICRGSILDTHVSFHLENAIVTFGGFYIIFLYLYIKFTF